MQQEVVRRARVDELPIIARQRLETGIDGFDENVGTEPGRLEYALDPEHFVADCIAVTQRCEHLMNCRA
jgi:hypothetical protein